jgi:GMP synthase-like glutamine amidotransferase
MRIGILVCDHVLPEFRHVAGDYPDMFSRLFAPFPDVELVFYDLTQGEVPASLAECDGWVTTGSKRSVHDDEEWIDAFAELVRRAREERAPLVGICFGHQMMAHALGGEVRRSERGWGVGAKRVALVERRAWMGDGPDTFILLNSHADQVEVPPPGAEVLGGNEHCPVSIMTVGDTMVGIQGHPEFVPEYSRALMEARRGTIIPDEVVEAGLASLAHQPDDARVAGWIVGFLAGRDRGA